MRLGQIAVFIVVILGTVILCWANPIVENQIGSFNLAGPPITESKLVSQFGKGYVQIDRFGEKVLDKKRIYYVQEQKVWVEVRLSHVLDKKKERVIEAILVSKEKLCDEKFKPKKIFGQLITSRGVQAGDSIEKVIKIYGKPAISIDIGKDKLFSVLVDYLKFNNGQVLRYLSDKPDELLFAEFYFTDKGLHSIIISREE